MLKQLTSGHLKTAVGILLAVLMIAVAYPTITAAQSAPAPAAPGSSFEQRLAQRKNERQVKLETRDQVRLQQQCSTAQNKVRAMQQKNSQIFNNRARVAQQMDGRLWILIGKLKLGQKDTFALEKNRATLAEKYAAFQVSAQNYQQVLDDLVLVNCKADPAGFKALLDSAKLYHEQLKAQSADIRAYLVNDIKPTLSSYASDLQAKPATEGN